MQLGLNMMLFKSIGVVAFLVCLSVFLLVSIFPAWVLLDAWSYNYLRFSQILLLLSVPFVVFQSGIIVSLPRVVVHSFLLLVIASVASALLSQYWANGVMGFMHLVLLFGLMLAAAVSVSDAVYSPNPFFKWFSGAFLLCYLFLLLLSCLNLVLQVAVDHSLSPYMVYPVTDNIRWFNQIQIFAFPLMIIALSRSTLGVTVFLMLVYSFLLMFIGGARGLAAALFVVLIFSWWCMPVLRTRILVALLALCAAAMILWGLRLFLAQESALYIARIDSPGRFGMWREAVGLLEWHHILWGVGLGNYTGYVSKFPYGHLHNSLLQLLFEVGLVGCIAFSAIVGAVVLKGFKYVRAHPDDVIAHGMFMALIGGLGYSLVSGVYMMPAPQTLLFLFLGFVYGRASGLGLLGLNPSLKPALATPPRSEHELLRLVEPYKKAVLFYLPTVAFLSLYLWLLLRSYQYLAALEAGVFAYGSGFWSIANPFLL